MTTRERAEEWLTGITSTHPKMINGTSIIRDLLAENAALTERISQFDTVTRDICTALDITYGGVGGDHGQIVSAIEALTEQVAELLEKRDRSEDDRGLWDGLESGIKGRDVGLGRENAELGLHEAGLQFELSRSKSEARQQAVRERDKIVNNSLNLLTAVDELIQHFGLEQGQP